MKYLGQLYIVPTQRTLERGRETMQGRFARRLLLYETNKEQKDEKIPQNVKKASKKKQ